MELPTNKEVLPVWKARAFSKRMLFGKRQRDASNGVGAPQEAVSPSNVANVVVVATVRSSAAITKGFLDNKEVDMMLDSGSSISLVQESVAIAFSRPIEAVPSGLKLVSAAGDTISVLGCITLPVCLGKLHVKHPLVVVRSLIAPVILGVDFLQKHGLTLDFTSTDEWKETYIHLASSYFLNILYECHSQILS